MIDLEYLSARINELIGTNDFVVYTDTNYTPNNNDTDRTTCVMTASRNPQALGGSIDCETLTITLSFDFQIAVDKEQFARRKQALTTILGWKSFQIHTPYGETYDVDSWLDALPPEPPRIDEGELKQIFAISGTALVANHSMGAVVSNRIRNFIDGYELVTMSSSAALAKGADELVNLSSNSHQIEAQEISQTNSDDITVLYTGSVIDKYFRNLIELGEDSTGEQINRTYILARVYPDITIMKKVKLIEATNVGQAGAFFYYKLTFRKVEQGEVNIGKQIKNLSVNFVETLSPGESATGTATVEYYNAESDSDITWDISSLPTFISYQIGAGGIILQNNSPSNGIESSTTLTITAISNVDNFVTKAITVTVNYFKVATGVSIYAVPTTGFDGEYVSLGKRATFKATVTYNDGSTDENVRWSFTTDEGITGIYLNGGVLTNESTGSNGDDISVTVTATTADGTQTASINVTCEGGATYYGISYIAGSHSYADGPTSAREGEEVTVYTDVDENYTITNISAWINYGTGSQSRIAQANDMEELTFTMPDSNVTITTSDTDY